MSRLLCFLSLALCVAVVLGLDTPVPRYAVNLDLPPEERWAEISRIYAKRLDALVISLTLPLPPIAREMLSTIAAKLLQATPQPYRGEILGIAQHTNLSPGSIMLLNLVYELTTFKQLKPSKGVRGCTSIVIQDKTDGIIHGRNLDWDFGTQLFRDTAITVDFQKRNKTVFTGSTVAGYVGLVTGQRPNKFTVSLDQRSQGNWDLNSIMAAKVGNDGIVSFLIRDSLANPNNDFETAVKIFSSAPLIAPCYFIVGGVKPNEGVVITRDRNGTANATELNVKSDRWYVLETNYDSWNPPPENDNRRGPAKKALDDISRNNISNSTLFQALSTRPVLNNSTIMTVIMSAAQPSLYKATIRSN